MTQRTTIIPAQPDTWVWIGGRRPIPVIAWSIDSLEEWATPITDEGFIKENYDIFHPGEYTQPSDDEGV